MLGHKILWESVARIPLHKSALRGSSSCEFQKAARAGVRDPIVLTQPDAALVIDAVEQGRGRGPRRA